MARSFFGDRHKQPCLFTVTEFPPVAFNRWCYYSHASAVNIPEQQLHHHHHHNFGRPPPITNLVYLLLRKSGRGFSKACFRFHGGTGDGRCGVACPATEKRTFSARRLQLFQALDRVHPLVSSFACPFSQADENCKSSAGGFVKNLVTETGATGGTGVFLPVYSTGISYTNSDRLNNNGGMGGGGGAREEGMGSDDGGGAREEGEQPNKDCDEDDTPLELLLPPEWTY